MENHVDDKLFRFERIPAELLRVASDRELKELETLKPSDERFQRIGRELSGRYRSFGSNYRRPPQRRVG
jgi:hypothetical protein